MPPASHAAQPRRRAATTRAHPRPRRVALRQSAMRVRWERLGRTALLWVFAIVLALAAKQGLTLYSTYDQARGVRAVVARLARENRALERERATLSNPVVIAQAARRLGMVEPGERAYSVVGLHGH